VIVALVVVVALVGMVILFVVVGLSALGKKSEMDVLAGSIARGELPGLAPFGDHLLPWISCDLVGTTSYVRPMGGALTGSLAATIPSCAGPSSLLALRAEITSRHGRGQIDVLAGGPRVGLALHQGMWFVTVDGAPLGAIEPSSGRIDDVQRVPIGQLQRASGHSQLHLRGALVATLARGAAIHDRPSTAPRPLLQMSAPPPPGDAAMWLLAVVGLELATALTPQHGGAGSSSGVP
jgi:hypothetical protein